MRTRPRAFAAAGLTAALTLTGGAAAGADSTRHDAARVDTGRGELGRQVLGERDGWAAHSTGTTGGAAAAPERVHTVSSRAELVEALGGDNGTNRYDDTPKIVYVRGTVDINTDDAGNPLNCSDYADPAYDLDAYLDAYDPETWGRDDEPSGPLEEARARSQDNQAEHAVINVGSNTTIVGLDDDARIIGGGLFLREVDNVIVRNIEFSDAFDCFPAWDPTDGSAGNWNSEYDNLSLRGATHVWIDHCTVNDGGREEPTYFGRPFEQHDGLLDVTRASDLVTVSYNRFHDNDKAVLVGGSDSHTEDEGHLRVTFHHNLFEDLGERTPRVRYGQVHVFNNLYRDNGERDYGYSWGVGFRSAIYAQNNVFAMGAGFDPARIIRDWGGTAIHEEGTMLGGRSRHHRVDVTAAHNAAAETPLGRSVGWEPTLYERIHPTQSVAARVSARAGAGRVG